MAKQVIASDKRVGGILSKLKYLEPESETKIKKKEIQKAKKQYFKYLAYECGEIQLEGLPADQKVGAKELELENLYVPLFLKKSSENSENIQLHGEETDKDKDKAVTKGEDKNERKSLREALERNRYLSILSIPGGGKTTFLKRLAVAYAIPERKKRVKDDLPDAKWLPLFIRCRKLGGLAEESISQIISEIPLWAEMKGLEDSFSELVSSSLQSKQVLLLIDGLDEISEERKRVSFVNSLRTFLAIYPTVTAVITSREAGFRIVAGSLSSLCANYRIDDFNNEDIETLTVAWHKVVVGDRTQVVKDAQALSKSICDTDRVKRLASNPLLLTTLLLVKRWVGELPRRRSVLYGKAIEVLLMTWNVEGHEPLEQDEAIPQLAFVAYTMMKEGSQRITVKRLKKILEQSRKEMPETLGYAKLSVNDFIERIEQRSSLLILSGHEIEDGNLYSTYEFRHLTFQEYLTAIAIVEGHYPDRQEKDTLLSLLEPYLEDERWKEVIPLAAVLAGRDVQPLLKKLIELAKELPFKDKYIPDCERWNHVKLMAQLFIDEVQASPELLEEGLEFIGRKRCWIVKGVNYFYIMELCKSKYGNTFQQVLENSYMNFDKDAINFADCLAQTSLYQKGLDEFNRVDSHLAKRKILGLLTTNDDIENIKGALVMMALSFFHRNGKVDLFREEALKEINNELVRLLDSKGKRVHLSVCWAFCWFLSIWKEYDEIKLLSKLFNIWFESVNENLSHVSAWAIKETRLDKRKTIIVNGNKKEITEFLVNKNSLKDNHRLNTEKFAALKVAYYLRYPWNDDELIELIGNLYSWDQKLSEKFLENFGEIGKKKIKELKEKKK
ncbi:MAG: NACHT domain-containing protein [Nitrospinae bacterium]|nr:NACHT domain-containing protein [Nitrospinota bacterium]